MSDSEEEHLVYLEFDSLIDTDILKKDPCVFKMIGIDTDVPVLQIGQQVFAGQYHDIPGTALFFDVDPNPPVADPVFSDSPDKNLQFVHKTRKGLRMSRVFVKKKYEPGTPQDKPEDVEPVTLITSTIKDLNTSDKSAVEEPAVSDIVMSETQVSEKEETDVELIPGPSQTSDTSKPTKEKDTNG